MRIQQKLNQIAPLCAWTALLLSSAAVHAQTTSFSVTIPAQSWFEDYIAVPNNAASLAISLEYVSGTGPVGLFLTNMDGLDLNDYGVEPINSPGGYLLYGLTNNPPLAGGTWYNGIYNYNTTIPVTLNVQIGANVGVETNVVQIYTNNTAVPLVPNGTVNTSQICITNGQQVIDVSVGVRLTYSNLDDLELQLTSPQGSNIVLFEDLGGALANNMGLTVTNAGIPGYVYTTFTEDANLDPVAIASGVSPYAGSNFSTQTSVYSNGFEGIAAGTYSNGQTVAGWVVGTNQVSVVSDGSVAHKGSNYLALANGRISQTFTTIPGTSYQLVYYARSPGLTDWWPADGTTSDIVSSNNNGTIPYSDVTYEAGKVNQDFDFSGAATSGSGNEVDFGTNAGNFGTNQFSVDFWMREPVSATGEIGILEKRPECDDNISAWDIKCGSLWYDSYTGPGQLLMEIAGVGQSNIVTVVSSKAINDDNFHHVVFTRQGPLYQIYIDGALDTSLNYTTNGTAYVTNSSVFRAGNSACFSGDGTLPYTGDLDELDLWQRALSPAEVHAIFQAGSAGKYSSSSLFPNFQAGIAGIGTNTVIISNYSGGWQVCTESFVATSNQTTLELAGNTLGVLLDDLQLEELSYTNTGNYYIPEQSLTPLFGQNPQGCWTLSIWDTRQNASMPTNGSLLGWTLQLTTPGTNFVGVPPTTITAQPQSVTVPTNTNATFSVTAIGTAPLSYQWYFSNPAYQYPAGGYAQMFGDFVYNVVVTNEGSGYTSVPQVHFIGGGGSGVGATATLSSGMVTAVTVTNAGSNYTSLPTVVIDPPSGLLTGQTNASLTLNAIKTNNGGNYYVVISNIYGAITSSLAALTIASPPSITQQPSNQTGAYGYNAAFNVTAAGTQPLSYQWWTVAPHQTTATATPVVINGFVLGATVTKMGSGYLTVPTVQFVGGSGSGAAGYAQVGNQSVTNIPITSAGSGYTTPPAIQIGAPGALVLPGQTSATLFMTGLSLSNVENYYVVVTNNYGSVTSSMAGLTLFLAPQNFTAFGTNNNEVALQLTGTPGFSYILQTTTDLTPPANWLPVLTNPADTNGNWSAVISNSLSLPSQFFRAVGQ